MGYIMLEMITRNCFDSDVRFVVHKIENIELAKGQIQLGIRLDSPPITGRVRNFQLFEEKIKKV